MSTSVIKNKVVRKESNKGLYLFLNEIFLGRATPKTASESPFFINTFPLSEEA